MTLKISFDVYNLMMHMRFVHIIAKNMTLMLDILYLLQYIIITFVIMQFLRRYCDFCIEKKLSFSTINNA